MRVRGYMGNLCSFGSVMLYISNCSRKLETLEKKKTINVIYYVKIAKGEKAHDSLNGYRKAFGSIQYLSMKKRNSKPGMDGNVHNVKEKKKRPYKFSPT